MSVYDLSILPHLIDNKFSISISEVPSPFRKDLLQFIVGETMMPGKNNEIEISERIYKAWINKLIEKGFDEDVDLRINE